MIFRQDEDKFLSCQIAGKDFSLKWICCTLESNSTITNQQASKCFSEDIMQNEGETWNSIISLTTTFCTAIHFSVGQGDSHYRWGNQLLPPHHPIFMKHLANGLEVNISSSDKTETYTQRRTSKSIASHSPFCEYPHMLMLLINDGLFCISYMF